MAYDLVPRSLWRLPSLWEDDDDTLMSVFSPTSGVSISEDDQHVYVTVAVPGLEDKDVEVTFDKGVLWVKGQSEEKEEDKKKKFYRQSSSSFSYRVLVPGDIDSNQDPEADLKNGVLTATFSKSPKAQPKKIAVKSKK